MKTYKNLNEAVRAVYLLAIKQQIYDFLWWSIGSYLWRKSAQLQKEEEVNRRLSWMRLDCIENNLNFSLPKSKEICNNCGCTAWREESFGGQAHCYICNICNSVK